LNASANAQTLAPSHTSAAAVTARAAQSQTTPNIALRSTPVIALRPDGTSVFTIGVKCGWWSGTVQWGGLGIPSSNAYIQVTGTVYSSCNSTTYVHISYTEGLSHYGPTLFAKTGPESNGPADFYASSIIGTYGNITIQACSNRYGWTCASRKA
jgi:hypothetical protein